MALLFGNTVHRCNLSNVDWPVAESVLDADLLTAITGEAIAAFKMRRERVLALEEARYARALAEHLVNTDLSEPEIQAVLIKAAAPFATASSGDVASAMQAISTAPSSTERH
ncbi:hypothetical protein [Faunimonas pinastri]|nr:hypothetical protein [Faunimonas pinastri]